MKTTFEQLLKDTSSVSTLVADRDGFIMDTSDHNWINSVAEVGYPKVSIDEDAAIAARLAHSYNVLPALIAAVENVLQYTGPATAPGFDQLVVALEAAKTVEVPNE